jgi:hypothetical protein
MAGKTTKKQVAPDNLELSFEQTYNRDAARHKLTWTHYLMILSVKNEQALMS